MKNFCTFLAFLFLLIVSVRSDVIKGSCDEAAKDDPDHNIIKSDFCVASLKANPKSKTATIIEDLVPIAIEVAIANATATGSTVSKLLQNTTLDKFTRSCLEACSELYSNAGSDLQSGGEAFKSKDFGTAKFDLSAAMVAPVTCEDGFNEKQGVVSPLTKENENMRQLAVIPLAFIDIWSNDDKIPRNMFLW
ncbi:Pectinesterase inhibitor [Corchorus capsularis]|uniref:Pectinesterase inhibitor n=1 Tax=Corchorus capsularis TaxID=210143 RepID=A0A1R3I3J4_COCAP|nr:Pectinesterase inhibitor [Corchorus capsularis]